MMKRALSDDEIKMRNDAAIRFVSSFNVGSDIFEREETQNLIKTICKLGNGRNIASDFVIGRKKMNSLMKNKTEELFNALRENGAKLAKQGKLALKTDYVYSKSFSTQSSRDYFCVAISIKCSSENPVDVPIAFKAASKKTHGAFLQEFKLTLKV